ncbi:MAG: hypothetical protein S4CHLAM102_08600 [Chlamydiia bacterium]|nr:hypothetical protein [Chlamydiia bacterium]
MSERPLECSQCQKEANIEFRQVSNGQISRIRCCKECPILKQRLFQTGEVGKTFEGNAPHLACEGCHTTLQDVLTGEGLGCVDCYRVFEEAILSDLLDQDRLPARLKDGIGQTLHVGSGPDKGLTGDLSEKIYGLNCQLKEALETENYEDAASLRDQIQSMMDNPDE